MKKILFMIPSTVRGGVEEYSLKMTSALAQDGWDVHAAFPQSEATESVVRDLRANNGTYHRLEIAEVKRHLEIFTKHLLYFIRTVFLLLKVKPDVVEIVLPYPPYCFASILACGFLGIPTLIRFGLIPHQWQFSTNQLKLYAWARSRSQQYLAITQYDQKLIADSFQMPQSEICCVYNGMKITSTTENLEQLQRLRLQVRQEMGMASDCLVLLTVGRLATQKGYQDLIPAIPYLLKDFPKLKFVWVGEGPQQQELINQLKAYGLKDSVLMVGYRSDVPRLLQAADLFVFPTHYEGQSWAIAEAMAYGLPIVTSNASGIPEVIEHKVHGLLFRTADSCDLLETLRWALNHPDLMQSMAENAKLRIKDFSEEKMVDETIKMLNNVAQNNNITNN